jgi:hypothetical protein
MTPVLTLRCGEWTHLQDLPVPKLSNLVRLKRFHDQRAASRIHEFDFVAVAMMVYENQGPISTTIRLCAGPQATPRIQFFEHYFRHKYPSLSQSVKRFRVMAVGTHRPVPFRSLRRTVRLPGVSSSSVTTNLVQTSCGFGYLSRCRQPQDIGAQGIGLVASETQL